MKTKIIKITNLSCILCINKLNTVLSTIPNISFYKVNIFTKEILIKYKRRLPDIIKELNNNGFETKKFDFLPYFISSILIIIYKISKEFLYIRLFIILCIQFVSFKQTNLKIYRYFSIFSFLMYFIRFNDKNLDNSCDILMYVLLNNLITEKLNLLGRLNLFKILDNFKFRKIISNFDINQDNLKFRNIKKKKDDENFIYYEYVDTVKPKEKILYKKNDKIQITGIILQGTCKIDNSSNTGEDKLKFLKQGDILHEEMLVKEGQIIVQVTKINLFDMKTEKVTRSKYNEFIVLVNILSIIYSLIYCDNLPEVLEFNLKMNMKICPCIFIISDIILKLRINKDMKARNIRVNDFDISKDIKNVFIDKTGTLTRTSKVVNYKLDRELRDVVYELEEEFDNSYSRGILEILKNETQSKTDKDNNNYNIQDTILDQDNIKDTIYDPSDNIQDTILDQVNIVDYIVDQDKHNLIDKEYLSSYGLRCKYKNNEIRIGKYEFCNYLNLKSRKYDRNTIYVSKNGLICGFFMMEDFIKKNTKNVLRILQSKYRVILLSGDTKRNVEEFCSKMNIKEYFYNLTSSDKADIISRFKGGSCMIGDGLNDLQAFSVSSVSIGLRDTLNTSINIQDIKDIVYCLEIIKRVNRRKVINYWISGIYNLGIIFMNIGFLESTLVMYIPNLLIIINTFYL
ncbi:putative cation-transporting P-type ATPase [Vairimorpha necatrix]|uniref:Cation-transporting P-type ATPase n=1 Tax=Vairimorpha necatrix TaxID=6039 RepID=A0AAX4J925_9MICR